MLLVTARDVNRLGRSLGISDGEVRRRYMENKYTLRIRADRSCIFLDTDRSRDRCLVYDARPDQCRRFPFGPDCPYLKSILKIWSPCR